MSDSKKENPKRIANEENIEQMKAIVSELDGVLGERKEVDVKDYPKAARIGQLLKDLDLLQTKRNYQRVCSEGKASEIPIKSG